MAEQKKLTTARRQGMMRQIKTIGEQRMETGNELSTKRMTIRALGVAWPAVMESFFVVLAGMIDTIMVSAMGESAISAIGLTVQPKFIGLTIFFGINVAVSALVARRKGEQNQEQANEILLTAVLFSLILCAAITALFVGFAPTLMRLSGSNALTHEKAVSYFRIIMGGTIFNVITMVINAAQRGSGNTRLSMTTNLTSSIVNVICNYFMIPIWGIEGAAIATVLGTVVAAGMAVFSLFRAKSYVSIPLMRRLHIRFSRVSLKSIWRIAYNSSLENIAARVGFLATALVAARLGTEAEATKAFAAHNIGMQLLSLGFSFADGMQVAAIALTGEALGAGKKETARKYGRICQRIGLAISVILFLLLIFGGRWFFGLFSKDADVLNWGVVICRYMMVIILLQISQIIFSGCLRAAGDVRYVLMAATISIAIIRTAVTVLLVYVFGMGLDGVWIGILADQLSRFTMVALRFRQGKWVDLKI